MFKVPDGIIKIGLIAETSTLRTKWRIWKSKLMFVRRLQQLDSSALARQVYERQLKLGLLGLAKEVTAICDTIKIKDVNYYRVEKEKIEEHIFYNHYKDMKDKTTFERNIGHWAVEMRTETRAWSAVTVDSHWTVNPTV